MAERRNFPFVWPTWLTPLLAGEAQCWFAPWIKSHFQITKVERGTFDLAAWKVKHAEMVAARADELRQDGWTVTTEDQNAFKLRGRTALLSGKPDILAVRGDEGLVDDCKGGARKASDLLQVCIYLFALPLVRADLKCKRLSGRVTYRDGFVDIQAEQFTDEMRDRITAALVKVGSEDSPEQTPSPSECSYCDVGPDDCSKRMAVEVPEVATGVF